MIKEERKTYLRLTHGGKDYKVSVDSIKYTENLILNKLKIGNARYWLIFQNESWRFIGDMPLCRQIKSLIVRKIATWLQMPADMEAAIQSGQESIRSGILLNALLCVMALKKQIR